MANWKSPKPLWEMSAAERERDAKKQAKWEANKKATIAARMNHIILKEGGNTYFGELATRFSYMQGFGGFQVKPTEKKKAWVFEWNESDPSRPILIAAGRSLGNVIKHMTENRILVHFQEAESETY